MLTIVKTKIANTLLLQGQEDPSGFWNTSYRLFEYLKPYRSRIILLMLITIPMSGIDSLIVLALKPYVDGMLFKQTVSNTWFIPLGILLLTALQGVLTYFSIYLNGWIGYKLITKLREDLFLKLQSLHVAYFDYYSSGYIIQRFYRDPENLKANLVKNTQQIVTRISSAIFLCGVLIVTSWQLSIIAIIVMFCIFYPSIRIRKKLKALAHEESMMDGDIMTFYSDCSSNIIDIYAYNQQDIRKNNFLAFQKELFNRGIKNIKIQGWLTPSMHLISSIGIALILWIGSTSVLNGEMTAGTFVSFLAAMLMLYNPIKNLGSSLMNIQFSITGANRIFEMMDLVPQIQDRPNAIEFKAFQNAIEFKNVFFRYELSTGNALSDCNLTIKKGETIALVGESGGGKSTIVKLIPRLYEVAEGAVLIDNIDVRDYTLESLRQNIAIVMQGGTLFNGTFRSNLLIGKPNATDQELWDALEKAYLADFVRNRTEQLDDPVGERGTAISGGQRQRLSIARAILKNAPIVIFDEATSALDNESEAIVQKALDSLMADKTVIMIAHRLSTIKNADRIIVVKNTSIVEEGTQDELLALNQEFAKLYYTQFTERDSRWINSFFSGSPSS